MFEQRGKVTITEVGPRDGLQNESQQVPTGVKIELVERLARAGLPAVEMTSFVHPKWIPALADNRDVAQQVDRRPGTVYSALVPNLKGMEAALAAGMDHVAVFISASESHNQHNVNASIAETLDRFEPVLEQAREHQVEVRGYVSTVFGCPYEGQVPVEHSLAIAEKLQAMGTGELSLGDTIGTGTPDQVWEVMAQFKQHFDLDQLALHFHDTRGLALANVAVALEAGVRRFDSSLGGLGGCPYAPGAAGNVATEDLVNMLEQMGYETGVDLDQVCETSLFLTPYIDHPLPSRYLRVYESQQEEGSSERE